MTKQRKNDNTAASEFVLRVTGGPAAGNEFPLSDKQISLGRATSADISLPDNVISRLHTAVYYQDGRWVVKDLESTNGTWVKGHRLRGPMPLELRTPVRIGNTLFEIHPINNEIEPEATLDESLIAYRVRPMTVANLTDSADAAAQVQHEQRKLAAIYQLQSSLSSVSDDKELFNRILHVISEVIPADSSYLMAYIQEDDNLVPVAERNAEGRVELVSDTHISKSIVAYVKERNEGILSSDASNDNRFHGDSLYGFDTRSVMCVPIVGTQKLCGIIYLSITKLEQHYGEEDLQLLSAISHSAGLTIENRRLMDENIRSARMAAIGLTAASLSHYVKNILGGLEGSVSLLRLGIDSEDISMMDEAWKILAKNHRRLSTLMLDLLNLSREDSLEIDTHNIAAILTEVAELINGQLQDEAIQVCLGDGITVGGLLAEVDNRGIHRVVLNLVNNAVDAIRARRADNAQVGSIEVNCRMDTRRQSLLITVADNGVGIAANELPHIFDMFHTSKGEAGTGLGLAVSKRIVENHGGIIEAESELGVGTTFTVKLPAQQQTTNTGYIRNINDSIPAR